MSSYDVIIVGARAAGAATAMLLARRGNDVLLLDRARRGTDTLSTHVLMRAGVIQLERWGLLDRVIAAGTPPIGRVGFRYGDRDVPIDLAAPLYAPRRTVLDPILVDAAEEAGAHARFGARVQHLLKDDVGRVRGVRVSGPGGRSVDLTATVTVGADGLRSLVARDAGAELTTVGRVSGGIIYGYVEGLRTDQDGIEWHYGPAVTAGLIPTNDGRHCVFAGAPTRRFRDELRFDLDAALERVLTEISVELAGRIAAARRVGPLRGFPGVPGRLYRPFGDGWALVGDAGYFKDPQTAHGLTDAMRDAELLARAIDDGASGRQPLPRALAGYERIRDGLSRDTFAATEAIAGFRWSLEELAATHRDLSAAMRAEVAFLAALGDADAERAA